MQSSVENNFITPPLVFLMMAVWDVSRQTQVLFPATGTVTVEPALLVTWNCQSPKARALLRVAMVAIKRTRDLCIFLLRMGEIKHKSRS